MPTQGRQGVLSLSRAWTSPVFYTTGPRRGEVAREATRNRNRNGCFWYNRSISVSFSSRKTCVPAKSGPALRSREKRKEPALLHPAVAVPFLEDVGRAPYTGISV